jgi:hypothetical protein
MQLQKGNFLLPKKTTYAQRTDASTTANSFALTFPFARIYFFSGMKRKSKNILQQLLEKRKENILLLSKWSDEELDELLERYREAKEIAYEENRFESYKILEEKISQLHAAKDLKFGYTDEASEWIHW